MILFSSQFNYLATSSQCRLTFPAFLARSFMLMSPVNPVKRKNLRFGGLCRNVIFRVLLLVRLSFSSFICIDLFYL
jgi:hypothetical protein